MNDNSVEGNISVKAVILGKKRVVEHIYVDGEKDDRDTKFILREANEANIPVTFSTRSQIDTICEGKTHGGICALCGPRDYQDIKPLLKQNNAFIALVEGVEDPYNFGGILRVLYASGCDCVILPQRNWSTATNTVCKASAGALEHLNLYASEDLVQTLSLLKSHDYQVVSAQRKDAISLYSYTFPHKFVLAIGGEMRGISKKVNDLSNINLAIPYNSDVKIAMSALASTAILSFEYVRQKQK